MNDVSIQESQDVTTPREPQRNELYPVFFKLDQFETLVVGAGNVALEKLQSLLGNAPKAKLTVIAPVFRHEVRELLEAHPQCHILERNFEENDLNNKRLVVCATDDRDLHIRIRELAHERGILVNVADTPELCDFYLGSIVQKGNLKIAVSTNGKSPTIAKRMREALEHMIPDEMEEVLEQLQIIRNKMKTDFSQKVKRLNEITKELAKNDYE